MLCFHHRYLAELEMKLQLSAEDVEMVLQEHSLQAMQRIPTAVHEVKRMQVLIYTLLFCVVAISHTNIHHLVCSQHSHSSPRMILQR